jgi:hypothetical protein
MGTLDSESAALVFIFHLNDGCYIILYSLWAGNFSFLWTLVPGSAPRVYFSFNSSTPQTWWRWALVGYTSTRWLTAKPNKIRKDILGSAGTSTVIVVLFLLLSLAEDKFPARIWQKSLKIAKYAQVAVCSVEVEMSWKMPNGPEQISEVHGESDNFVLVFVTHPPVSCRRQTA